MAEDWTPLEIGKGLFANLDEDATIGWQTAIENSFANELGGQTRFPGLREFVDLAGRGRVYMHEFDGDLMAATSQGRVYRINRGGATSDVTAVPVSGGRRVIFAQTDREILMAAGGPIVTLRAARTELLSESAPLATHVAWIDNFTLAIEANSQRFFHSAAGNPRSWDPLDTFAADSTPDNINSMIVTPFRELLLGGAESTEQFERLSTGSIPFYRRWAVGDGIKLPYGMTFADNATWALNTQSEFIRFAGQQSEVVSNEVGRLLEKVTDWTDAWTGTINIIGQKFIILQAPHALNSYGTDGLTLIFDYRTKKWASLYGWLDGLPQRWPGWSIYRLWDRVFIGGEGKIYELTDETHANDDQLQRWLIRTSHLSTSSSEVWIKNFRLRLKRGGLGSGAQAPQIRVRCSRNGKPFGRWIAKSLGAPGDRVQFIEFGGFGIGSSFQFEIACWDDCPIELIRAEIKPENCGH